MDLGLAGKRAAVAAASSGPGYATAAALHAIEAIPARVLGQPPDFGAAVAFLWSQQARYITGVGLPIDGGINQALQ